MYRLSLLPFAALLAGCPPAEDKDSGTPIDTEPVFVAPECATDPGVTCIVAGTELGQAGFTGDGGDSRNAQLYRPMDVAPRPGTSDFVVVDWNNHRLRMVGSDYVINTIMGDDLPGDGPDDQSDRDAPGAPGVDVKLNHPVQVEWSPDGNLYLPAWHNHKIRIWTPATGMVVVIAGDVGFDTGNGANGGFAGDTLAAEDALLFFPNSIIFDDAGGFMFVDQKNLRLRTVDSSGIINTVAGSGSFGFEDATLPATLSDNPLLNEEFSFVDAAANPQPEPAGAIEFDADGNVYVADTWNHIIRHIDFDAGTITTVAGTPKTAGFTGDGGPATSATLNTPRDIEMGPDGRLYIADAFNNAIRAYDPVSGTIETVAGTGVLGMGDHGTQALEMDLNQPYGIDFDDSGALFIADTMNNRILRVNP